MLTMREAVGVAAVVVGAATLAAVSHHVGGQGTHARETVEAVANRLEGRDIPRRGPRLSYEQLQEAIALYGRGWSLSRAERFGVYPLSIRYRLQRSGVKLRPRPGWSSKST